MSSGIKGVIPLDMMAGKIRDTLDVYSRDVAEAVLKAVAETSAETVLELKRTSPKRPNGGAYARDWASSVLEKSRYGLRNVVHNKTHYRLTHLLENGHSNPRAVKGKTWTPAKPHIGLAEAHAIQMMEEKVEQYINDIS